MVVCNVERFLAEAIESILDQTLRDFEFIIVDFGSTDGSTSIISRYKAEDSRIKFHVIPHCRRPEARNASCFLAQSRYIAIMDADDVALKHRLMWQVEFMERNPEIGVLGGAVEFIDAAGRKLLTKQYPLRDAEIKDAVLLHRASFAHPAVVMRKQVFVSVGGYRSAFVDAQDYDLWLRIAERCQMANLDAVVLKYRIHPDQVSHRRLRQQAIYALAARVAASTSRNGAPDPLSSVKEITPAVLAGLGVSEAILQRALATEYVGHINLMSLARQNSAALSLATEMLSSSRWQYVERSMIAGTWLTVARLYWEQGRFFRSFLAVVHAIATRPIGIGQVVKHILTRLRSASSKGSSSREATNG